MAKALQPYVQDDSEFRHETWRSWWSGEREMKAGKLALLDRASGKPEGFIRELVLGGIPGQPFSPLHAHFDALDAAGYFGRGAEDWVARRQEMALSALKEMHRKWRPDSDMQVLGAFLKSSLKIQYEALPSDEEREAFAKKITGGLIDFSELMEPVSDPALDAYDYQSVACMLPFLLAVGHDKVFMTEDKIDVWAWDLATASLALYGLYIDYDETAGIRQGKASWLLRDSIGLFWMGREKFLTLPDRKFLPDFDERRRTSVILEAHEMFIRAQKSYAGALEMLGLLPANIKTIFDKPWSERKTLSTLGKM